MADVGKVSGLTNISSETVKGLSKTDQQILNKIKGIVANFTDAKSEGIVGKTKVINEVANTVNKLTA